MIKVTLSGLCFPGAQVTFTPAEKNWTPTKAKIFKFEPNYKNYHWNGNHTLIYICSDNVLVRCGHHGADAVDIAVEMATGSSASCYFLCVRVRARAHTHRHAHTQGFWATCASHTHTHGRTHSCLTQSQPVDDNLAAQLRKCFISQLPLPDKARVPTVCKAGGSNVTNYPPSPRRTD